MERYLSLNFMSEFEELIFKCIRLEKINDYYLKKIINVEV